MFWDSTTTKVIEGAAMFIDENGSDWLAHHLIDADAEPLPDSVITLFKTEIAVGESLLLAIDLASSMTALRNDPEISDETRAWANHMRERLRARYVMAKEASLAAKGGAATALTLPTFLGNHDMGRFAYQVRKTNPGASEEELFRRVLLGHALMMFARGTPVIYYGDEQGFSGDGGDQDAREDMFASQVASYNDNRLVGSLATTAQSSFRTDNALYLAITAMTAIRASEPALRSGDMTVRAFGDQPGLFAFSRRLPGGPETLVVLNSTTRVIKARLPVEPGSDHWRSVHGDCVIRSTAPGSYAVEVKPLEYLICAATAAGGPH